MPGPPTPAAALLPALTDNKVLQSFFWGGSRRSLRRWADEDDEDHLESPRGDQEDDDERRPYSRRPASPTYSARTWRTMCVRLCDGYAWPVSFAASPRRFERDALACATSCDAPAKLYVHRNPGETLENAVDLQGRPYTDLKTAFLFRTTYSQACACRPQPWSQAATATHRLYALDAAQTKAKGQDRIEKAKAVASARTTTVALDAAARAEIKANADKAYEDAAGEPAPNVGAVDRRARPGVFVSQEGERNRAEQRRSELRRAERAGGGANADDGERASRRGEDDWRRRVFGD